MSVASLQKAQDEATSSDLAAGARLYFECARAADDRIGLLPGYELVAPFPVMQNVGQALELAMKSYLKAHYVPYKGRRGHSLVELFEKCASANASKVNPFRELDIDTLVLLNAPYEGEVLRYGGGPSPRRVPHFGPVMELALKVLEACQVPQFHEYEVIK